MMSFLTEHYDPSLGVDATLTAAALGAQEVARLRRDVAVARVAGGIPRRLGADVGSAELAEDKRRARRVAHVFEQCHKDWTDKKLPRAAADEEVSREAATLVWETWWGEKQLYLLNRVRYIVTWCNKTDQNEKGVRWTKSAVVRLQNEHRWLEYALR